MSKFELETSFKDSNGNALVIEEVRVGPPLSKVGEKLRRALVYTHLTYISITTFVPDDFPQPERWKATGLSLKKDGLLQPLRCAFGSQLSAYLGLFNMLALDSSRGLLDRLLAFDSREFNTWLERIGKVGSVTG